MFNLFRKSASKQEAPAPLPEEPLSGARSQWRAKAFLASALTRQITNDMARDFPAGATRHHLIGPTLSIVEDGDESYLDITVARQRSGHEARYYGRYREVSYSTIELPKF